MKITPCILLSSAILVLTIIMISIDSSDAGEHHKYPKKVHVVHVPKPIFIKKPVPYKVIKKVPVIHKVPVYVPKPVIVEKIKKVPVYHKVPVIHKVKVPVYKTVKVPVPVVHKKIKVVKVPVYIKKKKEHHHY